MHRPLKLGFSITSPFGYLYQAPRGTIAASIMMDSTVAARRSSSFNSLGIGPCKRVCTSSPIIIFAASDYRSSDYVVINFLILVRRKRRIEIVNVRHDGGFALEFVDRQRTQESSAFRRFRQQQPSHAVDTGKYMKIRFFPPLSDSSEKTQSRRKHDESFSREGVVPILFA